jgi:hypothetical protein
MKSLFLAVLAALALAACNQAPATGGLTREQVRQELVDFQAHCKAMPAADDCKPVGK